MGWSEKQTLYSDVNAILLGLDGQIERIRLQNGSKDEDLPVWVRKARAELNARKGLDEKGRPRLMTPKAFDAMFTNRINKGPRGQFTKIVVGPKK